MAKLDAVLFDADGVIQLAPDYLHLRLLEAIGRTPEERETCMAAIFAAEAPALTGGASFEVGLERVLRELGAKCDVGAVLELWRDIRTDQAIMAMIWRLRATGVYCALASNQELNRARHMSQALGYGEMFDGEFYSCELGHMKPSAMFFEEIMRRSALVPQRTLFIDDRLDNVEAARKCGFLAEPFVLWQIDDGASALGALLRSHGLELD